MGNDLKKTWKMPKPQEKGSYYAAQTSRLSGVGFMVFEKDDAILSVVQI